MTYFRAFVGVARERGFRLYLGESLKEDCFIQCHGGNIVVVLYVC